MVSWIRCRSSWKLQLIAINVIGLSATCVFNVIMSPVVLCLLDGRCSYVTFSPVTGVYPRTVAIACLVTFATLTYKYRTTMPLYDSNMQAHDVYSPATAAERRHCALFHWLCIIVFLSVTLPINVSRLVTMYGQNTAPLVLVFFVFMYAENISMCMVETLFATLCHTLAGKFSNINRDLERLGEEAAAEYQCHQLRRVVYDSDFYGSSPSGTGHSIANAVEIIRIRHRLIRDAVYVLIDVFGVSMAMSLITLCVMAMFDIYYQVFDVMGSGSRPLMYIYMWLLQYSIRFYVIVVTAHNATKQVYPKPVVIIYYHESTHFLKIILTRALICWIRQFQNFYINK